MPAPVPQTLRDLWRRAPGPSRLFADLSARTVSLPFELYRVGQGALIPVGVRLETRRQRRDDVAVGLGPRFTSALRLAETNFRVMTKPGSPVLARRGDHAFSAIWRARSDSVSVRRHCGGAARRIRNSRSGSR